jgi:hypothetical protein
MQISGDLSRPAAHVAGAALALHQIGEAVEKHAVERLVVELVDQATCVLDREAIVARTSGVHATRPLRIASASA